MDNINNQFLTSILIILLGYVLKRVNLVQEKDGESLARIVFNVTLPCLIIATFSTIKIEISLIMLVVISIIYGTCLMLLGLYAFGKESRKNRGMFSMLLPGFNVGLFAYPLVEALWGKEGLKYFGMFDVGNSVLIFGLAYITASYFADENAKMDFKTVLSKLSKSMPLISYIFACILNFSAVQLPQEVFTITNTIAKANMPLSLLLLGVYLNFSLDSSYLKSMMKVLLFRYIIGLVVGIALFVFLPFGEMFKYTLLIGLILPICTAVIPFAVEFHYDHKFVGALSNITILLSFGLVWIIVSCTKLLSNSYFIN